MESHRKYIIGGVFIVVGLAFLIRLFIIQVISEEYKLAAQNSGVRPVVRYPDRGVVFDRNGKVLVYNRRVYDLMVTLRDMDVGDTASFCHFLGITKAQFEERIKAVRSDKNFSSFRPAVFLKQLSEADFARIQDILIDYPGFFVTDRSVRAYPHSSLANALGYTAEISAQQLESEEGAYYRPGDFIGKSGIEKSYEIPLRGKKGVKFILTDVRGLERGSYKNGIYDTLPEPGADLTATIDLELQQYGEQLMLNKTGSIVAIEPSSGEILTIVSAPSYDPNMLTGGNNFSKSYLQLQKNPLKPLYNRPMMATYPPGSIFKLAQALIAEQENIADEKTTFPCNKQLVKCHNHPSPLNLKGAIKNSCNPYFYALVKRIVEQNGGGSNTETMEENLDEWNKYMQAFGFGHPMGTDIPGEKGGRIPTSKYYNKKYGEGHWRYPTIYSISIGQGEVDVVPVQMANLAAMIANRGFYYIPHIIKKIGRSGSKLPKYKEKQMSGISSELFTPVVDAMEEVVLGGTATRAALQGVSICGKTGTAQNSRGKDHSVFIAFAPKENPKIAIAVYVENSGFGGTWAAPIASLMIEKYLKGKVERVGLEDYILKADFVP